jgi:CubicO group peptidase (beta-lactamase class C family)
MGDAPDGTPWPPDVDRGAIDAAVARAFAEPEALTAAFVVVHRGRILAERYAAGIDRDTQLESWSMGKTLLATLMALLVKDGTYRLDDPAPVPAWRAPGDPRGAIRIVDLLRMSSGLRCTSPFDPDRGGDETARWRLPVALSPEPGADERAAGHAPRIPVRFLVLAARPGALLPPATWLGEVRTWVATKLDVVRGLPGS